MTAEPSGTRARKLATRPRPTGSPNSYLERNSSPVIDGGPSGWLIQEGEREGADRSDLVVVVRRTLYSY